MKTRTLIGVAAVATLMAAPVAAQAATLKMQFIYGGDPPEQELIPPTKDIEFCGKHDIPNEKLIVNEDNRGIKNVVVYLYTGRGGSDVPKGVEPSDETLTLANRNCRFDPHIVIAQTGDTLKVTNPDEVGHNANLNFFRNQAQNFTVAPGQEKSVGLTEPEPAPMPVDCNIHPWMRAYVVVLEHPFVAKSDENGVLEIEGLPADEELTFRVYHEGVAQGQRLDEVTIDGEKQSWRRSRFEVELEEGVNDMGKVVIPAETLTAD